jgi:hypothetical protein
LKPIGRSRSASSKQQHWGRRKLKRDALIYVDTSKQVGHPDHLKVFANADAAETWFENDPEGVAFE